MKKKNSKNTTDELLGAVIDPLMDGLITIVLKGIESLSNLTIHLTQRYIFKTRSLNLKKIERKDILNSKTTRKDEDLGYSTTRNRNIKLSEIDRRKHTAVIGASGFGKSVLLDVLMYGDMQNNKPVIFIDPKGDNKSLHQFINLCKLSGRDYSIFSEHYNGAGSISLNPVKEGSSTHIADRIHESFDWSEEHYEVMCYRALKKSIEILQNDDRPTSFTLILEYLYEISNPKSRHFKYKRENIEGIIARLENLTETDFGPKLKGGGLSFKQVWDERKCVYIGLPVLGYAKTAKALGKIIYGDLSHTVYDQYKYITIQNEDSFSPFGVYIDELSAIIDDRFIEILNKCRGIKMELTYAFQSPSDIKKVSNELCQQILENGSNWFVLKQRMSDAAESLSASIGTLEGKKTTVRFDEGKELDIGSLRNVEEMISHPNIIKNLRPGQAIFLRHGPTQVDLINIKYIDPHIVADNIRLIKKYVSQETKESTKEETHITLANM